MAVLSAPRLMQRVGTCFTSRHLCVVPNAAAAAIFGQAGTPCVSCLEGKGYIWRRRRMRLEFGHFWQLGRCCWCLLPRYHLLGGHPQCPPGHRGGACAQCCLWVVLRQAPCRYRWAWSGSWRLLPRLLPHGGWSRYMYIDVGEFIFTSGTSTRSSFAEVRLTEG